MTLTQKLTIASIVTLGLTSGVVLAADDKAEKTNISAQQAIDIALKQIPGVVEEVELEDEDNLLAWELELVSSQDNKEYEILIDAHTGEILKQELDDDDSIWGWFDFSSHDKASS